MVCGAVLATPLPHGHAPGAEGRRALPAIPEQEFGNTQIPKWIGCLGIWGIWEPPTPGHGASEGTARSAPTSPRGLLVGAAQPSSPHLIGESSRLERTGAIESSHSN